MINFRHLIIDESHTWVRGRAGNERANQLRFLREHLLPKAETVWHLSGTVFPAETKFDLQQTLMSLATNRVRKLWKFDLPPKLLQIEDSAIDPRETSTIEQLASLGYDDESLRNLYQKWDNIEADVKSRLLVPIILRRTGSSVIDGKQVSIDWAARVQYKAAGEIPLCDIQQEMEERRGMMRDFVTPRNLVSRLLTTRNLSWSSWAIDESIGNLGQQQLREKWKKFTLADARRFRRGRILIDILENLKREGLKPIIFSSWVFQLQFAARVSYSSIFVTYQ